MRTRERRALRTNTTSLLDGLGNSAMEVAASLERHGVRGNRNRMDDCPVSRYLSAVIGGDGRIRSVRVTADCVELRTVVPWSAAVRVKVPRALRAFVLAFDAGVFPHLIDRDRPAGLKDPSGAGPVASELDSPSGHREIGADPSR
jgi:hypothetical protein